MSDAKTCADCIQENDTPKTTAIPLSYHTVNRDPECGFLHSELFLCWDRYLASPTEKPKQLRWN